jgi:hypothetical protein
VNKRIRSIRWPLVLLLALAVAAISAVVVSASVVIDRNASVASIGPAKAIPRPTLQTYIQSGIQFLDEDEKQDLLRLIPYESISLERTPCFGRCPVYVFVLYKNGHATLVTDNLEDNEKKYYIGNISLSDYARLAQMVTLAKEYSNKRDYMAQWTDDSTAIIRAQAKSETWVVTDYGRVAPVEVWALESQLHAFRERIEWTRTSGP